MTQPIFLERLGGIMTAIPGGSPAWAAMLDLIQGFNEHQRALWGYLEDGRVSQARYDELLTLYRGRLLAQVRRLADQLGRQRAAKGGAA